MCSEMCIGDESPGMMVVVWDRERRGSSLEAILIESLVFCQSESVTYLCWAFDYAGAFPSLVYLIGS